MSMKRFWKSLFVKEMPSRLGGGSKSLVGVIDDGTRTVRFVVYEAENTRELCAHQLDKVQSAPQEGWSEQDPREILKDIHVCVDAVLERLLTLGYSKEDIVTLGITNQRETTIVWDKFTGEPLHPAIVWNDIRTASTVDAILAKNPERNKNYLKALSGLPVSPYFSALKMRWLKDNVRAVRTACTEGRALFGTVDSWIVWNLTGGVNGGLHITDVTNASRTLLMNIDTLNWDPMLCKLFNIHPDLLPEIRSSSEVYGVVKNGSALDGITISGILGNQQSALVGQMCLREGQAKNTYREGCFLIYNTGTTRVQSTHGLVTTVAYKLGPKAPAVYALEGSIAVAGGAMKFLRDKLQLIRSTAESEQVAGEVSSTGDVYFVPAFSGLYAPYWRKDARGILCGLTAFTTRNHIIRAALEAVCFQTRDILEAMNRDCGVPLTKLHVDGNMTSNNLLMQLQADLIGMPVLRSHTWDMTALGAALVAGNAVGVWSLEEQSHHSVPNDVFLPNSTDEERDARYTKWKMAVQRSLGWTSTKKSINMTGQHLQHKNSVKSLGVRFACSDRPRDVRNDSIVSDRSRLSVAASENEDGVNQRIDDLIQYSARKFSLSVPIKLPAEERTILDDADFYRNKRECDFGGRRPLNIEKIAPVIDWETIEAIIERDPEIIFDSQNNPIVLDNNGNCLALDSESLQSEFLSLNGGGLESNKKMHLERLQSFLRNLYGNIRSVNTSAKVK